MSKQLQLVQELRSNIHQLILVSGKMQSGKSYLIKGLVYMLAPKFKDVLVISPSVHSGYEYVPNEKKHEELTIDLASTIKEEQKANGMQPLLVVVDDSTGMKLNKGELKTFITTSRHFGVTLIFAAHGINKFPTTVQESCNTAFVFKTKNQKEVDSLHEVLLNTFDDKKSASNYLKKETADKYRFLMVRNYEHPDGRYASGIMPELPEFKLKMQ